MTSLELEGKRSLVNTEEYLGNTEGSNEVRDHEFINDTSLHSCVTFFQLCSVVRMEATAEFQPRRIQWNRRKDNGTRS